MKRAILLRPTAVAALTKIFLTEIERLLLAVSGWPSDADMPRAARQRVRRRVIRWFKLKGLLDATAAADMVAWQNSGFSIDAFRPDHARPLRTPATQGRRRGSTGIATTASSRRITSSAGPSRRWPSGGVLHLLGLDHTRLSFYNNAIERRLTDVHGHVIEPILA